MFYEILRKIQPDGDKINYFYHEHLNFMKTKFSFLYKVPILQTHILRIFIINFVFYEFIKTNSIRIIQRIDQYIFIYFINS